MLEKSKLISVDPEVPENLKSHFPPKISSTIRAWASVNWEQYVALDVTKHLVDSGAVDENDFLFRYVHSDENIFPSDVLALASF